MFGIQKHSTFDIIMAQKMNYEDLPIDIHYNKLTEWLISRRHCQQNWPASALAVRDKINGAIKKLPDHEEVTKIIQGSKVNYVHVKKIVEFLSKDTESGKKNLFGQYANEMTKEWSDILKLYEKDNVYLIESAQIMARNVNYEIPALKRQITRCQQIEKDCQKREEDYVTKAADLRRKYENACKRLGIEGKKVKAELYAQVHELPELLDSLCRHVIAVEEASIYYGDFVNFLMQNENLDKDCVPLIKYIIKNGNTTVYEWRTGKKPISIIDTDLIRNEEAANENNTTEDQSINWDAAEEIDFGDVEFDMSQITLESAGGKDDEAAIDWGDGEENKTSEETSDEDDGIARGDDSLTLLESVQTRNLLMEDLMELEFFLTQRLFEIEAPSSSLGTYQFHNAPDSILRTSSEVCTLANTVQAAWQLLNSERMKHLLQLKRSPKYVDRLEDSLRQNLTQADKMVFREKEMILRKQQTFTEEEEIAPKLEVFKQDTLALKKQVESEISQKYNDRIVNIMGEINTI